jgi:4-diphosphocytidyl-2-C-methyl-D-erythritol kinase
VLEFVVAPEALSGNVIFTASGIQVDGSPENNLCVKAYHLLAQEFKLPALQVHLHKIIPMGAGLGGGSSDGAFMLKMLNGNFQLGLSEDQLCDYASQLGSDCAFFIKNRPLYGYERGNRFRELPVFPSNMHIVLVNPGIHVGTSEAYAGVSPAKPTKSVEELVQLPVEEWKDRMVNDFEKSVIRKHPAIGVIKDKLYNTGADYASMTGSGSTVYGLYKETAPDVEAVFPDCFVWKGKLLTQKQASPYL